MWFSPSATVCDLGVFIDQDLTMKTHVQQTASRCFATLRQLRSICRCIPTSVFNSLVSALVLRGWTIATVSWSTCLSLTSSVSSQSKMPQQGSFSTWDVVTTSPTRSSAFIGSACRSELYSRWRRWRIVYCMVLHHLTWRCHSHVSLTCRTDAGSGPPPLNNLTFRPVVGQPSEVMPFLLLEQRCGMACLAMLSRPRRCRCSRTGWRHTRRT